MNLDLKDKKVRRFKLAIDCMALIFLAAVILEGCLRLFCPQLVRFIDSDGKGITSSFVVEKGSIPYGFRFKVEAPEYNVEYYFNNDGFRDVGIPVNPKPEKLTRFLILGDSFTYGGGNHYEDVFTKVFENLLLNAGHDVDVVNAGNLAGDTLSDVVKLKILSEEYDPDITILVIHTNDLLSNKAFSVSRAESIRNKLRFIAIPIKQEKGMHSVVLLERLLKLNDLYLSKWHLSQRWKKVYLKENDFRIKQAQITKDLLLRAKAYADSGNMKLFVLLLPDICQVISKANGFSFEGIDWDVNDAEFKEFAERENIFMFSALEAMASTYKNTRKDLFYRYDGHLTPEGNRLVGEYLFEKIKIFLRKHE